MKTHVLLASVLLATSSVTLAQTNPTPVSLPFTQPSQTATTAPTGMAVHKFGSLLTTRTTAAGSADLPNQGTNPIGNSGGWYNLSADGIGILASSTNPAGAIVVSINTTGQTNIAVSWKCKTIFQQASRDCSIALQYRTDTTGAFINVGTTSTYTSMGQAQNSESSTFIETLPAGAENQPLVQVRWIYWESNGTAGSRDKIAVKNISITAGPVPVTLTRFNAIADGSTARLGWSTAQEINNSHFEIERSENGKEFTKIGVVKGAGNTDRFSSYSYIDAAPLGLKTVYYRLRQVDFDGKFEYSPSRIVRFTASASSEPVMVYPNPKSTLSPLTVNFNGLQGEKLIEVYDMNGRLFESRSSHAGAELFENISTGIYIIKVASEAGISTSRLIVE